MLERVRRAVHVAYIDHKKTQSTGLESSVDSIFDNLRSIIDTVWATKPIKREATKLAADELRRVVKEELVHRHRENEA